MNTPANTSKQHCVPIVGIGASAGGLEALTQLVRALDPHLPFAYVVLQHLSPNHKSMMADILGRETELEVVALEDRTVPKAGVMYVVPANYNAIIRNNELLLRTPGEGVVPKPSVNEFFIALAAEQGEHATGVVLSGTASDGTAGLRAIQAAGGVCVVQKPETAKYDGMPRSAIDAGVADFILPPEDIARRLSQIQTLHPDSSPPVPDETLNRLLKLLQEQRDIDFSGYKTGTLARRIRRRIVATNSGDLNGYLDWVEENNTELDRLARDILISVTAFFRDDQAFHALQKTIRGICEQNKGKQEIRVWVAGCATGEEAYSIAILFAEALGERIASQAIQIFATDIDQDALNIARRGRYPAAAVAHLPEALIERYFYKSHHELEVGKRLRDMIVFARHNLVDDPPFLRLDLVTCRNVLIYFDTNLQAKVLRRFHFALKSEGVLFLGRSESIVQAEQLFGPITRKERLFHKRGESAPPAQPTPERTPARRESRRSSESQQLLEGLIQHFHATAALCDAQGRILHTAGQVSRFFHFPVGSTRIDLSDVVIEPLRGEMLALLHKAQKSSQSEYGTPRLLEEYYWRASVHPVKNADRMNYLVLVARESPALSVGEADDRSVQAADTDHKMHDELVATREHLQALIEELATSNEEMQSLNEEAQAANEELQATNEELEAANEELQATNEELVTLNQELNTKTREYAELNAEYTHVYDSLVFPLLIFDEQKNLKRFNAAAERRFNLKPTARRQSVSHLHLPGWLDGLEDMLSTAQVHGMAQETTEERNERIYQLTVTPGMDEQGAVNQLIVALVDITEATEAQRELVSTQNRLQTLMDNTTILLSMKDLSGRYAFANPRFLEVFGFAEDQVLGKTDFELFPESFAASLWTRDLEAMRFGKPLTQEHVHRGDSNSKQIFKVVHQLLRDEHQRPQVIINEAEDISVAKQAQEQMEIATKVFEGSGEAIVVTDNKGVIESVNRAFTRITGYEKDESIGVNIGDLLRSGKNSQALYQQMWDGLLNKGQWQGEIWNRRKNGEHYPEWLTITRLDNGQNQSASFLAIFSDITEMKESQSKAEYLASHDSLTGLPNRAFFQDRLKHALAGLTGNDGELLAVMFIDLDDFKAINDTLGHNIGDELLIEAAARLTRVVGEVDSISRIGGDEFTVVMTNTSYRAAERLAHRIVETLSASFNIHGRSLFVSASIGLAFAPDDGEELESLTKAADSAMYRAKENGRNRFELFKPEMHVRLMQRATIENALRAALDQDYLRLVFQPKFRADNEQRITGVEALIRWRDPTLGDVSPGAFIPVAEQAGLIDRVDRFVIRQALQALADWRAQGLAVVPLAINISARSFQDVTVLEELFALSDQQQISPELLQLEITERTLVEQTDNVLANIERLRSAGFRLSIDDFGTGYSSLSYLKTLPLAELKIDKSFVDGLGIDNSDSAIAKAILALAESMDLKTVAEGVETAEQVAWLVENSCDYLQGFYLSRPLEQADFERLLH